MGPMENVVFSVIMPCYNSEAYVRKALDSIVNQTYENWELVVINDGSTDGTLNILSGYAEGDHRIKVFSKENGGYTSAANYGLGKISGDYFLLLGSDDYLSNALFQSICEEINKIAYLPDCIAFRTQRVVEGVPVGLDSATQFASVCAQNNTNFKMYLEQHPEHSAIFETRDTSKCYKTSLLNGLRYFGKYGLDADGIFSMLFCHKASSFLSIPHDGYFWVQRGDSLSSTVSAKKNLDKVDNWIAFYEELDKLDCSQLTPMEKNVLYRPIDSLVELSSNFESAVKYRKQLKEKAAKVLKLAESCSPDFVYKSTRMISISPVLFSILYKIRTLLGKNQ